ncbi:MAG: hypothetical protein MUP41_12885 [Desulfobacterales bacterium]|nr:hypothetical protein [Desulfobacterales bacterium]
MSKPIVLKISPPPSFSKRGNYLPFAAGPRGPLARRVKGGEEEFGLGWLTGLPARSKIGL